MAQASQALVYAMLVEAQHDRHERRSRTSRRSRRHTRGRILPDFLG